MSARTRWWREPALHFMALGAAVFAIDAWRHPRESRRDVVVSASYVRGLREDYARRNGRPPTHDELRAEVDRFVRDEALYREAIALGLDRGDLIVRRRLVQKMEFLVEDVAPPHAPTDDELGRYLSAHRDRYALAPRATLRHIYFDRGRRGEHLAIDARNALEALARGADPATLGDPFMQGSAFTESDLGRLARDVGDAFARAAAAVALGTWSGPVESPYGLHLINVSSRSPGATPPLEAVRERVASDWRNDERTRLNHDAVGRIVAGYHVHIEGP